MSLSIRCGAVRALFWVGLVLLCQGTAQAQFFGSRAIGGIAIGPDHILSTMERADQEALRQQREQAFVPANGELAQRTPLRKISLRQLEAVIKRHQNDLGQLPLEVQFLGGLQHIRYVFVYPEIGDIVIAGPAEGWKLNAAGEPVGITTGHPVMQLDDLYTALRNVRKAQQGGITVSIDPTPEGLAKVQELTDSLEVMGDPEETLAAYERAAGTQNITFTGLPESSHFAAVLAAADYKMKRIGMNFEHPNVKGLPSYLEMVRGNSKGTKHMLPRWWIVPRYSAIRADKSGLAFELVDVSAKIMTESSYMGRDGKLHAQKGEDPLARKWADAMTAHYPELCQQEPVFGQLLNCVDLAVVAALIDRENLAGKAKYQFSALLDADQFPAAATPTPQHVESKASVVKKGGNWVIGVSGGIQIAPWLLLEQVKPTTELEPVRTTATQSEATAWWWN